MPRTAVQRLRQRPQAFLAAHRLPFDMLRAGLGSTAITADSNKSPVARLRYKAWGEARYTDGATPTTLRRYIYHVLFLSLESE